MEEASIDGNLVVCSDQISFGKDRTTEKLARVVVDMTDEITVGNGACVERWVVAARSPTVVLLGKDV
jgi:hypothetical protein